MASVDLDRRAITALARLPLPIRWHVAGLLALVDGAGRGVDDVTALKEAIWPHDEAVNAFEVERLQRRTVEAGWLQRYEVEGTHYFALTPNGKGWPVDLTAPSKIPAPPLSTNDTIVSANLTKEPLASTAQLGLLPSVTESIGSVTAGITGNAVYTELEVVEDSEGKGREKYPPAFEKLWATYPKREGNNSKADAFKQWKIRKRQGHTEDEMQRGVDRYAAFIRAKDTEYTEFVLMAATFLGRTRKFLEPWELPRARKPASSSPRTLDFANADIHNAERKLPAWADDHPSPSET